MNELLAFLETWSKDTLPSFLGILAISLIIIVALVAVLARTRAVVRRYKFLWYIQSILLVIAVLGGKAFILSSFGLGDESRKMVNQVSLTVLWLLGAIIANQALDLFVWKGIFLRKYKSPPPELLSGLVGSAFYIVALYGIMTFIFERPMTGFIVSSGIVVGVIGLAMQSSLSDLVAGVAISIERPFTIGEWVELDDGTEGEVLDINWRATHILSRHNCLYILPNARISGARVHNFHRPDKTYRHWVFVYVPSTASPTLVRRVLLQAALDSTRVLDDPVPVARLSEAGASYRYTVSATFASYFEHREGIDELLTQIWIHCAQHGIVPSAVTREIVLRPGVAEEITEPSPHALLAEVELFTPLDEASHRELVGGMRVQVCPIETEIVRQGDEGMSLFVIVSGMVGVVIAGPDGQTRQVATLGAGQYFGEMSLLVGDPRTATIVARTECQILEIDKDAIKPVFDRYPALMEAMARIVSERRLSNQALQLDETHDDLASRLNALAAGLLERMHKIFA